MFPKRSTFKKMLKQTTIGRQRRFERESMNVSLHCNYQIGTKCYFIVYNFLCFKFYNFFVRIYRLCITLKMFTSHKLDGAFFEPFTGLSVTSQEELKSQHDTRKQELKSYRTHTTSLDGNNETYALTISPIYTFLQEK